MWGALQAARYQVVVILLAAACSGIGSTATILLAVNSIVDQQHRVRRERLVPRAPGSAGVANWIQAQVAKVPMHRLHHAVRYPTLGTGPTYLLSTLTHREWL